MRDALAEAQKASSSAEVPVGAVLAHQGKVLAAFGNEVERRKDVTAHAEMLAIRAGAEILGEVRLPECELYVTLEPCPMCAAAISFARIKKLVFGAYDPKGGGVEHGPRIFSQPTCHHAPEVIGGIMEAECRQLLRDFFQARR
ncbi:nucleoside deaminase [bacterium]|nr:nucleoside deaminase [bacterium]